MTLTLLPVLSIACAALAFGALLGWMIAAARGRTRAERVERELEGRLATAESRSATAESRAASETELRTALDRELREVREALGKSERELAGANERDLQARRLIDEQKSFVENSRKELEHAFKSLAASALEGSTQQFLELAEQRWKTTRAEAAGDLEQRRKEIETLIVPLRDTLQKLDTKTGEIEKLRAGAYDSLKEHLTQLQAATGQLQEKTTTLASALRGSQVRGRWGELALRNVAELAGMSEHCDFTEQTTDPDGRRPDMVVKLPDGRFIAVDSKVPLTGYLRAMEAPDEESRKAGLREHVQAVRGHVRALAQRDYAKGLEGDVDLVVLFLPGDPFLAAAFAEDPELQVQALRSRVLLATPTTLVALLRTVAIYHQQRALADNAREIAETARELYDRAAKFGEDLARAGKGLKTAVEAYNKAVGSFERRFLPMGQKLESMKVTEQTRRELVAPEPLDEPVRELRGEE